MKLLGVVAAIAAFASAASAATCHCLPTESCWPGESQWQALNTTVKGRLVKVVPLGAVCHDPTYDEAACAALKASWNDVNIQ
jgi:hypothetical protein